MPGSNSSVLLSGLSPNSITSYVTSVATGIEISVLNIVYAALATRLTDLENHPTQSQYDSYLTFKKVAFQGINAVFSLFYVAAVKPHISIKGVLQVRTYRGDGSS